jgi:hemoglobin
MRKAHRKVVEQGLDDSHFDAMLENVRKTLNEMRKDEGLINEVIGSLEIHRKDVLGR